MVDAGVAVVRALGEEALPRVAKIHFATTGELLGESRRRREAHRPG